MVTSQDKVVRYASWELRGGKCEYFGKNDKSLCERCSSKEPLEWFIKVYGYWVFVCDECKVKMVW